jgi:hypothetical protein
LCFAFSVAAHCAEPAAVFSSFDVLSAQRCLQFHIAPCREMFGMHTVSKPSMACTPACTQCRRHAPAMHTVSEACTPASLGICLRYAFAWLQEDCFGPAGLSCICCGECRLQLFWRVHAASVGASAAVSRFRCQQWTCYMLYAMLW